MQHDRLTPAELDDLPAKTKKHPEVVQLYLDHDFLTAYAKHTDMRVAENPEGAIGNHLEWDQHGEWQRDFLIGQGLTKDSWVLEIGCGTGRLARKLVPWMDKGMYFGVDISEKALEHARKIADEEGWLGAGVEFSTAMPNVLFDCIWAFSVFIHLPADIMRDVFKSCAQRMEAGSRFYFSYVPEVSEARTGLKQFRHTLSTYKNACRDAGLSFRDVPWPHQQRIGLACRA